jgi:universal stress protein A
MAGYFKKILCPVDFEANSIAALKYARDLAKNDDATLYVLHAFFVPVTSPGFPLEPRSVSQEPSRIELENIAQEHLKGRVRYELIVRKGKPAEVINSAAEELNVDLVVLATHGRTGVTRLVLGSVAEQVVRTSKKPVLTLRPE